VAYKISAIKQLLQQDNPTEDLKPVPSDWESFCNLTRIRSSTGYEYFNPYPYQIRTVESVASHPMSIVCKFRQAGMSLTFIAYMLHECLLTPGTNCLILSTNQAATSALASRMREMAESIPEYCKLVTDSLQIIGFSNGSKCYFKNSSLSACRGLDSVKIVLFDEFSFLHPNDAEELFATVLPVTSMCRDSKIILNSTPNTVSDLYAQKFLADNDMDIMELVEAVKRGDKGNQYLTDNAGNAKIILHFRDHPIYGQIPDYLQSIQKKYGISEAEVQREHNLSFASSSQSVFSPELVRQSTQSKMSRAKSLDKTIRYIAGIDPNSSSTGNDYFVMTIFSEDSEGNLKLVDMLRQRHCSSEQNIYDIGTLLNKYDISVCAVEKNNSGSIYIERLSATYPSFRFESVVTSQSSKEAMVSRVHMALESSVLELADDKNIIREFLGFSRIGSKLEAVGKNTHDDIVLSVCMGLTQSRFALQQVLLPVITSSKLGSYINQSKGVSI